MFGGGGRFGVSGTGRALTAGVALLRGMRRGSLFRPSWLIETGSECLLVAEGIAKMYYAYPRTSLICVVNEASKSSSDYSSQVWVCAG